MNTYVLAALLLTNALWFVPPIAEPHVTQFVCCIGWPHCSAHKSYKEIAYVQLTDLSNKIWMTVGTFYTRRKEKIYLHHNLPPSLP